MTTTSLDRWQEINQTALITALNSVRKALQCHIACATGVAPPDADTGIAAPLSSPATRSALDTLCATYDLSPFERDTLLLCAGIELDSGFAALCAAAQGDPQRAYPTFSLALAALPDAHWTALTPTAPLRRARLIEFGTGHSLTLRPLRIAERVLHALLGVEYMEDRLTGLVEPITCVEDLVPSHSRIADRLVAVWRQAPTSGAPPVLQLCGEDTTAKRAIAAMACTRLGLSLCVMAAEALPTNFTDLDELLVIWGREATLRSAALLIDCEELDVTEAQRAAVLRGFIERDQGILLLATRERLRSRQRTMVAFDVHRPGPDEQRLLWQQTLGTVASSFNGHIDAIVSQFNVSAHTIREASIEALGRLSPARMDAFDVEEVIESPSSRSVEPAHVLWDACRTQARSRLDEVAQRIEGTADWDELILPEAQKRILRDIAAHVRQRATVYQTWGFAGKGSRGLGMSALFAGSSGTGKTMAAEVLAHELRLDVYRVDLSSVVSKYIGETEKNLRRVFDAAEEGGAILLFDEADALFGKRSEVKDSHDRYANIEVSYLLQRMESYLGLAILTTNMKSALDTAFLRRLRFIVQFPFPDANQRAEIWRRAFPALTPTEGLDIAKLARLNVAGGNIRSIALNAAFVAADAAEPVRMVHLLRAVQSEYAKLEKTLTEAEVADWL